MSDPMDYDAGLRLHNEVLRLACDISRHDRVLDIGCGAGQTTRDAARIAGAGWFAETSASADELRLRRRPTAPSCFLLDLSRRTEGA
jgi:SAM-dependent methyltransferase